MKVIKTLLVVGFAFVFTSCGVMFGGSRYNANIIVKNHPNAEIKVNGQNLGKGTANGTFKRQSPLIVEVKQEGCPAKTQHFDNTFRTGNFILSVIMWGIPGIIVDLGTGASFKPDHVNNPSIVKTTSKNFVFSVGYDECPTNTVVETID